MRCVHVFMLLLASIVASAYDITFLSEGWTLSSPCGAIEPIKNITVPSTIIAAQIQNELRKAPDDRQLPYSDPFFGKNINLFDPSLYQKCAMVYENTINHLAEGGIYLLRLNGVNYRANLTLDGNMIADQNSVVGGIRRYAIDITHNLLDKSTQRLPNRHDLQRPPFPRAALHKKSSKLSNSHQLSISVQPPVNPRGTDLSFSFLDWNPLPADFSGGLWRSVSLLHLDQGISIGSASLYLWSDGLSVKTILGNGGSNTDLATVTFDLAVQCYPSALCTQALVGNSSAEALIVSNIILKTDYPSSPLSTVMGSTSCAVKTSFQSRKDSQPHDGDESQSLVEGRIVCVVPNVASPLLWYPFRRAHDSAFHTDSPHIFRVTACLGTLEDAFPISEEKTFGLRQIVGNVSAQGSRQLFVNNEFVLIAGAGWSPDLFLRIDSDPTTNGKLLRQLELVKHMGVNTIRLEGKWEDEAFFDLCDRLGIMVIPGIECCSAWQNWNFWNESMTEIARDSIRDQLRRLASHPSVIAFLGSSDEIPPPSVEAMYNALYIEEGWSGAVIAAACAGTSTLSGPTGVKMSGPYSWVPPSYFLANSDGNEYPLGGGWGFLTEGGPGEAPMTYNAMKLTLPAEHLWEPEAGGSLSDWWNAHAGLPKGKFGTLKRFTPPLNARFGNPSSAEAYLFKAQLMNYEGIRAMYEAYSRNKIYNATGVVQWMLNNAYPSNVWHLYDYYLYGGGGYYGAKKALRPINMVLSYVDGSVAVVSNDYHHHFGTDAANTSSHPLSAEWFVYRLPSAPSSATTAPKIIASSGSEYFDLNTFTHNTVLFMKKKINFTTINAQLNANETYLVRLVYITEDREHTNPIRRVEDNWYWLSTTMDIVDWDYNGPDPNLWTDCLQWANFSSLVSSLGAATLTVNYTSVGSPTQDKLFYDVTVANAGPTIAFFVQLAAYSPDGLEIGPSFWEDNYITLMPGQSKTLRLVTYATVEYSTDPVALSRIEAISYNAIVAKEYKF